MKKKLFLLLMLIACAQQSFASTNTVSVYNSTPYKITIPTHNGTIIIPARTTSEEFEVSTQKKNGYAITASTTPKKGKHATSKTIHRPLHEGKYEIITIEKTESNDPSTVIPFNIIKSSQQKSKKTNSYDHYHYYNDYNNY